MDFGVDQKPEARMSHPKSDVVPINEVNPRIEAKNYGSLMTAMGTDMWRAYMWGKEGLGQISAELRKPLIDAEVTNTTCHFEEYVNKGEVKRSLFIEKRLDNGTKCIYVVDYDKSRPYLYRLDNVYAVDLQGQAVDLLEDVDTHTEAYFVPAGLFGFDEKTNRLYFGEFEHAQRQLGMSVGVDSLLHEIGHAKDYWINGEVMKRLGRDKYKKILATTTHLVTQAHPSSLIGKALVMHISPIFEQFGKDLLALEKNASDFARLFIAQKRGESIDLMPDRQSKDEDPFFDRILGSYEAVFAARDSLPNQFYTNAVSFSSDLAKAKDFGRAGTKDMLQYFRALMHIRSQEKRGT